MKSTQLHMRCHNGHSEDTCLSTLESDPNFEDDTFEFFHRHGKGAGAMQELCVQLGNLQMKLLDYEKIKERIYELEMRAGMHSTDNRQMDLF